MDTFWMVLRIVSISGLVVVTVVVFACAAIELADVIISHRRDLGRIARALERLADREDEEEE